MHTELPGDLEIRNAEPADHPRIIGVMKDWWGGRDLTHILPRLFLTHFCDTSFLMEKDNELAAFLIGFLSQSRNDEGYIHFVGVNPEFRGMGIGTYLYNRFFETCGPARALFSSSYKFSLIPMRSSWISSWVSLPSFLKITFPSLSKTRTSLLSSASFHSCTSTFL